MNNESGRVCYGGPKVPEKGRGYCGRKDKVLTDSWTKVKCADCRAAKRADAAALTAPRASTGGNPQPWGNVDPGTPGRPRE